MPEQHSRIAIDLLLPLKPLVFQVLMALSDEERHGWGLVREVQQRGGFARLMPGNFYRTLRTMLADGLIADAQQASGQRRRRGRRRTAPVFSSDATGRSGCGRRGAASRSRSARGTRQAITGTTARLAAAHTRHDRLPNPAALLPAPNPPRVRGGHGADVRDPIRGGSRRRSQPQSLLAARCSRCDRSRQCRAPGTCRDVREARDPGSKAMEIVYACAQTGHPTRVATDCRTTGSHSSSSC